MSVKREPRSDSEASPNLMRAMQLLMEIPKKQKRAARRLRLNIADAGAIASYERVASSVYGVGCSMGGNAPTLHVYHSSSALDEKDVRIVLTKAGLSNGLNLRLILSEQPEASATGRKVRHEQASNGTATCRVRNGGGESFVLGTNHVLAACNHGRPGDKILSEEIHVGDLYSFEPLSFHPDSTNTADAALYRPKSELPAGADQSGPIAGVVAPREGQIVKKYGAKTGVTTGRVVVPSSQVRVKYQVPLSWNGWVHSWQTHEAVIAGFAVEGMNERFAEKGDSGALIVDEAKNAVGMVVAVGSNNYTWAAEISPALACFGVSIFTEGTAAGD